jgi:hypothetical protein
VKEPRCTARLIPSDCSSVSPVTWFVTVARPLAQSRIFVRGRPSLILVTIIATGLPTDQAAAACERLEHLAASGLLDGRYHHLTGEQIIADLLTRAGRRTCR